jgi:hypothetical protein
LEEPERLAGDPSLAEADRKPQTRSLRTPTLVDNTDTVSDDSSEASTEFEGSEADAESE